MRNEITEGSLVKALIAIALPTVLSSLLQGMYNVIDMFWVGKLGAAAVAAVSLSFPFIFLMITIGTGLSTAGSILVSHYKGMKNHEKANYISSQTVMGIVAISVILGIAGYVTAPHVLGAMMLEPDVLGDAVAFLAITYTGMPFVFFYFAFQALLRGSGNAKLPFYVVLVSIFLNIVLDPIFIFGYGPVPAMGVPGAAIATVLTQALGAVLGLAILFHGVGGIKISFTMPHVGTLWEIVKLGVPSCVEYASISLSFIAMVFLVTPFGTEVTAAYGIGTRVLSLAVIPSVGLGVATAALVGQNMGARRPDRAEAVAKLGMGIGFAVLTVVGVIVFLMSRWIVSLFIADQIVIPMAADFMSLASLGLGFVTMQEVANGAFKGAGHVVLSMLMTFVLFWAFRFPLAYILSHYTSLSYTGIWWSFPISVISASLLGTYIFFQGNWKKKRLVRET